MKLTAKVIVDTNVPLVANLANTPEEIPDDMFDCVISCVDAIAQVIKQGGLVIDSGDEIYNEYLHKLCLNGQKGIGNAFMKWVHDTRWSLPETDRVDITKDGDSYKEFPDHAGLVHFDISDKKFIAVANAHPEKPQILQATDSKWWGWNKALNEVGITVCFLCSDYVKTKYKEKILA